MGTQHNANSGELGLDEFFKKDAHEESKGVTKAAAMKCKLQFFYFGSVFIIFISLLSAPRRSSQHMEKDVDKVGKVARFIKSKIEELDKEDLTNRQKPGCGKGTGVDRSKTATTLSLKKRLKTRCLNFRSLISKTRRSKN
ncbi:putative syntaxin domain-containing protein [Helianthus annuus]|nr:putative syntaxin domain-containing protein [Helianthus annuus]